MRKVFSKIVPTLLLAFPAVAANDPNADSGDCPTGKVQYHGRCLNDAQLAKAFSCPPDSSLKIDDSDMFKTRWCEKPSGKKVGEEIMWILGTGSTGHMNRRTLWQEAGKSVATTFHFGSHQPHVWSEVEDGKNHGKAKVWDQYGKLREEGEYYRGQVHGLWIEWNEDGEVTTTRCAFEGRLLWKTKKQAKDRPCPPPGFAKKQLPNNRKQVLFEIDASITDAPQAVAVHRGVVYVAMKNEAQPGILFRLSPDKETAQKVMDPNSGIVADEKSGLDAALGGRLSEIAREKERRGAEVNSYIDKSQWTLRTLADYEDNPKELVVEDEIAVIATETDIIGVKLSNGSVWSIAKDQSSIRSIVTDSTHVYWVNTNTWDKNDNEAPGNVVRASKRGGKPQVLAKRQGEPWDIVLDDKYVYWTNHKGGQICRVKKIGGRRKVLAKNRDRPTSITKNGKSLFWTEVGGKASFEWFPGEMGSAGAVVRMPMTGGRIRELVAMHNIGSYLLVDNGMLYWYTGDGIARIPTGGGQPEMLTTKMNTPRSLRVAGDHLYWTDIVQNQVVRIDKRARERQFGEPL